MRPFLLASFFLLFAFPALAGNLPDPNLTPGAVFPGMTADRLCQPGYAKSIPDVTPDIIAKVFAEYGLAGDHTGYCDGPHGCVLDHLVSVELGGSNEISNLWPESNDGEWNAHLKDKLEAALQHLVCTGRMPLAEAQQALAADWIAAYREYIGEPAGQ